MTLTDEQIEKAADAAYRAYCNRGDASAYTWWRDVARAALEAVMPGEPVAWGEIVNIASRAKHNGDCGGGYNFVGKDAAASALMELRASGYEIVKAAPGHPAPEPGELERLQEALRFYAADCASIRAGDPSECKYEGSPWCCARARAALAEGGRDE